MYHRYDEVHVQSIISYVTSQILKLKNTTISSTLSAKSPIKEASNNDIN